MDFAEFKRVYEKKQVVELENSSTESPLVSILVQTYRHVNYIKACLDSILEQNTSFEYEIILGEDGSNDGTREICLEYAKKYPDKIRLFLHHRENNIKVEGTPTGRFVMLYNYFSAKGKYVALCEGDDYWINPNKLQSQIDFLEKNPSYTFSVGRIKMLIEETGEVRERKEKSNLPEKSDLTLKDYLNAPFSQTASFVFTKLITEFPEWITQVHAADQSLVVLHTGQGGRIKYHGDYYAMYRVNKGSLSHNTDYNVYLKFVSTIECWVDYLDKGYRNILNQSKKKYRYKARFFSCKTKLCKLFFFIKIKLVEASMDRKN